MRSAMAEALQDLKDFLAKLAVHADVFSKITDEQPAGMEMARVADLGGYFTATEYEDGVQTEILDSTSQASDRLQRARLRAVWVKAKEVISTAAAPPQQLQKQNDDALPELGIPTKASSGTKRRQEPRFADDFCADWNHGQCTKKANDCPHNKACCCNFEENGQFCGKWQHTASVHKKWVSPGEGPRQVTAHGSVTALLPAHPTPQCPKSQMPFAMSPLPPARSRAGQHHVPLLNDSFHVNPGGPASSAWQAPPMSSQPPPSVQPQLDEAAAVAHKQQTKPACPQDCQAPGAIQYSRLKVGQGSLPKVPTWKGCLSSARDGAVWQ